MTSPRARWVAPLLLGLAAAGCRVDEIWYPLDLDFNRMLEIPRLDPYEPGAMHVPPVGTIPFEPEPLPEPVLEGLNARGEPLERIPIPLTRAVLESGREGFDTFCAACHGTLGYGRTPVAERMALRPPPSLHEPRIRGLPPGDIYRIVTDGYGLMPGYAVPLEPLERWAVVAYLRALQRSQYVPVAALTDEQRRRVEASVR